MSTWTNIVREHVFRHGPVTNNEIAKAVNYASKSVAVITGTAHQMQGKVLCRRKHHSTLSGVEAYEFWYSSKVEEVEDFAVAGKKRAVKSFEAKPSDVVLPKSPVVLPEPPAPKPPELKEVMATKGNPVVEAIDALVAATVAQFRSKLQGALVEAMRDVAGPVESKPYSLPPPTPDAPKIKHKALLVGLLPAQAGQIAAEFSHKLLIKSIPAGETNGLATLAANSDVVFNHVRHGSHAAEATVQSTGAKYVRVKGGVTSMREALRDYIAKEGL